jgi:hypothetical protein
VSEPLPRRDNGLSAPSYVRLVDVESSLVDGLLERLRDEEVAAYSAPAAGRRGPYGDTVLPEAPSDSVYVDSGRLDLARSVADRHLEDVRQELAWADIIAGFDRTAAEPVVEPGALTRPGPTLEAWPEAADEAEPLPVPRPQRRDDPDDHFQPPPPPPLPAVDTVGRFAWAGALGGPLLLVVAALAGLRVEGWVGLLALAAFVAGFVTLVARMKERPPDSGPDDGAVV